MPGTFWPQMGSGLSIETNVYRRFGASKAERSEEIQREISDCLRLIKSMNVKLSSGISPNSLEIKDDIEAIRKIMQRSGGHSREIVRSQIDFAEKIRSDISELRRQFCEVTGLSVTVADGQLNDTVIPLQQMRSSLHRVGLVTSEDEMVRHRRLITLNHKDQLTFKAFREIVLSPSPLEEWVKSSVPFSRILTDALPKSEGCDYLQLISQMTADEIDNVVHETCVSVKRVLESHVRLLRKTFEGMNESSSTTPREPFSSKFEVGQMRGGTINEFYAGLDERVGACPPNIEECMKAEHCKYRGSSHFFTVDAGNKTCPKSEWEIVMGERLITDEDRKKGRAIPDLSMLLNLEIAKKSKLSREEVVAVVLYTGPMYKVYNTILRKCPEAEYDAFVKYDNLFSTTIFVLASAVLKISKVMPLQRGLVLYRGLGIMREFPDSFYRADENGCTGYVEWGFMSTTARKEVAIDFGSTKDGGRYPKPHILAFRVGAADRGACIKDFSQYKGEEEYLYVPCSFVEESGPCYDEIGPMDSAPSLIRVYPVKVNSNLKTPTVEELINRKKTLHLAAFKYRIHEIRSELEVKAREQDAAARLVQDTSGKNHTVVGFLAKIVEQCRMKFAVHEATSNQDYIDDSSYRQLLMEMVEVKTMANSKFQEWIQNVSGSFIAYRYDAQLRTVHRRWIAFLEKKLEACSDAAEKQRLAVQVCKTRGFSKENVNERNELGETILMAAAAEGRGRRHLCLLVEATADVNSKREDGVSAMWLAAQFGHSNTVKTLFSLKASVNEAANNGATPLYIAAQGGNLNCIRTLIELSADLNSADDRGLTPVHQAAMNRHTECIRLLADSKAAVNSQSADGKTPLTLAEQFHSEDCVSLLSEIMSRSGESQPNGFKAVDHSGIDAIAAGDVNKSQDEGIEVVANDKTAAKLIVTAGDISDVDAMLALAAYARTGADVLFVMNYPAYLGVKPEEVDHLFSARNPGLGYKYSAAEVLDRVTSPPESYSRFMLQYDERGDANERMRRAMTDLAFTLVTNVWAEASASRKGRLYFCIGGINAINPFSVSAIKNEILLYSGMAPAVTIEHEHHQGAVFDANGGSCELEWSKYSDLFLDFNGPMSHWNESWQDTLGRVADRIRGAFIMGGVYANRRPVTSSSIPDVLNRFSSATMNQLYHPQRAADFFSFVEVRKIPTFVIPNNAIHDLAKLPGVGDGPDDAFERFMDANAIGTEFLKRLARTHYSAQYKSPRKPYDFYAALALVTWLEAGGSTCTDLSRRESEKSIFYSNVYGLALVSELGSWEEARAQYAGQAEETLSAASCQSSAGAPGARECLQREIEILRSIQHLGRLPVNDVEFDLDEKSLVLRVRI